MTRIHSQSIDDPMYKAPLAAISHIDKTHLLKNVSLLLVFGSIAFYLFDWWQWIIAIAVGAFAPGWGWSFGYPIIDWITDETINVNIDPENRGILGASGFTFILVGAATAIGWIVAVVLTIALIVNEYRNSKSSYMVVVIHVTSYLVGVLLGLTTLL